MKQIQASYWVIDLSMFPNQDWMRHADGPVALYTSKDEAIRVAGLFDGKVKMHDNHAARYDVRIV